MIQDHETRVVYDIATGATQFPVQDANGNPIFFSANEDIRVVNTPDEGERAVLVEGMDYTLSGSPESGIVTLLNPLDGTLLIYRKQPIDQELNYVNSGAFPSESHEAQMDQGALIDQELRDDLNRTIGLDPDDPGVAGDLTLPNAEDRRNSLLFFRDTADAPASPIDVGAGLAVLNDALVVDGVFDVTVAQAAAAQAEAAATTAQNIADTLTPAVVYSTRSAATATAAAALPAGETVILDRLAYRVDPSATGAASATNDLGVDGLVPFGVVTPQHTGASHTLSPNETAQVQAAVDLAGEDGRIYFPSKPNGYLISCIQLLRGQVIEGDSRENLGIVGDGTDVLIKTNDLASGPNLVRNVHIRNIRLENTNFDTVQLHVAPDSSIQGCEIRCSGASAVSQILSVRCAINRNRILSSGDVTTFKMLDNCNGSDNSNNTVSAGASPNGTAVELGRSQAVNLDNLVIEVGGGRAISVGGDIDPADGGGVCSGISMRGAYIEQVRRPIEIGLQFSVLGIDMTGLLIGNTMTSSVSARDSAIHLGRVTELIMDGFFANGSGTEALFELYDVTNGVGPVPYLENSRITSVNVDPTEYPNIFVKNAAFTAARENRIFGLNEIRINSANTIGAEREWISPVLSADVGYPTTQIIPPTFRGAFITSVDILDVTGDVACLVQVGSSTVIAEIASFDPETLTPQRGFANVIDETDNEFLRVNNEGLFRVLAGTGTGTFRIRVRYRN